MRSLIFLSSLLSVSSYGMILQIHPLKNGEKLTQALFKVIRDYNYEETATSIQKYPSLVNAYAYDEQEREKIAPVHVAASVGNAHALALLIKAKASVNVLTTEKKNSPLHCAYNKKVAKILIRNGAHVDRRNAHHHTPLYHALFLPSGHLRLCNYDVAHCLVSHGADVNQRLVNFAQDTLLHKAVTKNSGFFDSARFLLEHNANPIQINTCGITPLDLIIENNSSDLVSFIKTVGIIYCRISMGQETLFVKKWRNVYTDLEEVVGKDGVDYVRNHLVLMCENAFSYAQEKHYDALKRMLCDFPFVVSYDKDIAFKLLMEIMKSLHRADSLDMLRYVQKYGPNLSGVDGNGNTLLHNAILCKNSKAITWLIEAGIDCSVRNKYGQTVLDFLHCIGDEVCIANFYYTFASNVVMTKNRKMHKNSEKLLSHKNFCVHIIYNNHRTLLFSVLGNRPERCLTLLKRGANVNIKNSNGVTPLFLVIKYCVGRSWDETLPEYKYIVRLLLEYGALVDEKIIQTAAPDYMRQLLQQAYDKQRECCICYCYGREEMIAIPCKNKHGDNFMCNVCFSKIDTCPFCREAW